MTSRLSVVGNLVRDPELKFTNGGKAVCKATIADNYQPRQGEAQVTYIDVVLWEGMAENFAEFRKGQRVFAEGRLKQNNWETDSGEKRSKLELVADNAGAECRFDIVSVVKKSTDAPRGGGGVPDDEDPF